MLSALCPQCGRPAPVSLASPTVLRCPACRFAGPMPAETAHHLIAASHLLANANLRERQLSQAQLRALAAGTSQNVVFFLVLGVSALPTLCFAIAQVGITIDEVQDDAVMGCIFLIAPFFVVTGAGLAIWSWMQKRRKQLEDACSAAPPAAPGEPFSCHVCGAPLAAPTSAIARCGHCGADNVVSASVIARATQRRQYVVDGYSEHLRRELATVSQVANRAAVLSFASALLLPPATLVVLILILLPIVLITRPADSGVLYVTKRLPHGDCLGKVTPKRGVGRGFKLTFNSAKGSSERYEQVPSLAGRRTLRAADLVGKTLVMSDGAKGTVKSVDSDVVTGNHVVIAEAPAADAGVGSSVRNLHPSPEDCCFPLD